MMLMIVSVGDGEIAHPSHSLYLVSARCEEIKADSVTDSGAAGGIRKLELPPQHSCGVDPRVASLVQTQGTGNTGC